MNVTRYLALSLALLASGCATTPPQPPNSWTTAAQGDLAEIRTLLLNHHPGPVDTRNPGYRVWLEQGYRKAAAAAARARTSADYDRALSLYVNGFRDSHTNWWMNKNPDRVWPGFLVTVAEDGGVLVGTSSPLSPAPKDSRLTGCDGQPAQQLLQRQLYQYKVNPDIPHLRPWWAPEMFLRNADDAGKPVACTFLVNGKRITSRLEWRPIEEKDAQAQIAEARRFPAGALGMRKTDGIYFISVPSFSYYGASASKMQGLLKELEAAREDIRNADGVVLDLRGNTGGNSDWGRQIADVLWGPERVKPISSSFDWTSEFRTSEAIEKQWRAYGDSQTKNGQAEQAANNYRIADGIKAAREAGRELWLNASPATTTAADYPKTTPFRNPVYLLTDERCASACLDFADILIRMPGVVHIGRTTLADAIYIDNLARQLPSGLSTFTWSAKVYRNRVRGNNQWYTPRFILPRDRMTEAAVIEWVRARANAKPS